MNGPVYRRSADLVEAEVGEDLIALDVNDGACIGFNDVAAWVWRRLAESATFEQLQDGLLAEYDVTPEQCARELRVLLNELRRRKLIATNEPQATTRA